MTLDQLKLFCAIVEHGSYRNAAKAMHRTQPAITNAIQTLETNLGLQLFSRDSYRPTLTTQGKLLHERAKRLVAQSYDLTLLAKTLSQGYEPILRIAVDMIYPSAELSSVLDKLHQDYPDLQLIIHQESLGGAIERLLNEEVDIAISEYLGHDQTIQAKQIYTVSMLPIVSQNYFRTHQKIFEDKNEIANCLQLVTMDSSRTREKFSFGVIETTRQWCVSSFQLKKELILNGIGWGRVPKFLLSEEELSSDLLIILDYPHTPVIKVPISAMIDSRKVQGPIVEKFWHLINL